MFDRLRSRRRSAAADPNRDSRTYPCSDAKAHSHPDTEAHPNT